MQKRFSALKELCWNNINDTMCHMLHESIWRENIDILIDLLL